MSCARAWIAMPWMMGQGACLVPSVPNDRYADAAPYEVVVDASMTPAEEAGAGFDAGGSPWPGDRLDAGTDAMQLPPNPACDFSGRWLVTERLVASGIGIQQASLWWLYLEVEQSGDDLRVQKGLVCGTTGRQVGSLGVSVDMQGSWPALQAKNDLRGRTGRTTLTSDRCNLQWARAYRVLGATMPHYGDPARALPAAQQPAQGDAPGWEDWDDDGHPGVSIHISGVLNGTRYSASRTWTSYAGEVAQGATSFRLPLDWNQEESVLGVTTDALKAAGSKDGNATLHYAQLAKLADRQATGTDDEICAAVRSLAPQLTADAY